MRIIVFAFFWISIGGNLFAEGVNQQCDENERGDPVYFEYAWRDSDADGYPDQSDAELMCPLFHGTLQEIRAQASRWIFPEQMNYDDDGSVRVDCSPNDNRSNTWMEVWKDANQNGYSPKNTQAETLCLYPGDWTPSDGIDYQTAAKLGYTTNPPDGSGIFDCDDNSPPYAEDQPSYYLSRLGFTDKDKDGYGELPLAGQVCDPKAPSVPSDCNDSNPSILGAWDYGGSIAQKACGIYKPTINGKTDFTLNVYSSDLGKSKNFKIYGLLNNVRPGGNYIYCTGNCPKWTLVVNNNQYSAMEDIVWNNLSFDGMTPATPYAGGKFDPKKAAIYKVKMGINSGFGGRYTVAAYLTINYIPNIVCRADQEKIDGVCYDKCPELTKRDISTRTCKCTIEKLSELTDEASKKAEAAKGNYFEFNKNGPTSAGTLTSAAFSCLQEKVDDIYDKDKKKLKLKGRSAYRPDQYQSHLSEVYNKYRDFFGKKIPSQCEQTVKQISDHFVKYHGLKLGRAPAKAKSQHSYPAAIDLDWGNPTFIGTLKDSKKTSIDTLAKSCGLCRPFPLKIDLKEDHQTATIRNIITKKYELYEDEVHFELIKARPENNRTGFCTHKKK